METNQLEIGDKVKIVNFGHLIWESKRLHPEPSMKFPVYYEDYDRRWYDIIPEIVGQHGVIDGKNSTHYSVDGIPRKHAWYSKNQLEKINTI